MASIVSSRTDTLQNFQNIQVTVDTWDDGTRTLRTSPPAGGGGATAANQATEIALYSGALTDRSGTIATGATAQNAMAANASRKYVLIINPDTAALQGIATAEDLWFSFDATAVAAAPSICLHAGDSWESDRFVPTGALSVIAATTAHAYTCKEG